jgi:hypothetical protein
MRSRHQETKATRCRRPRPTRSSTYSEREREREREGGRGARHHARFYFICDAPDAVWPRYSAAPCRLGRNSADVSQPSKSDRKRLREPT